MSIQLPVLEYSSDRAVARIARTYYVRTWPVEVMILPGFEYDGASIPLLAQPVIGGPWDARRLPAATAHDWLYSSHAVPRWIADIVFLWLLIANGMTVWRAVVDWWAVARFGRPAWDSHGPDERAETIGLGCISFF